MVAAILEPAVHLLFEEPLQPLEVHMEPFTHLVKSQIADRERECKYMYVLAKEIRVIVVIHLLTPTLKPLYNYCMHRYFSGLCVCVCV